MTGAQHPRALSDDAAAHVAFYIHNNGAVERVLTTHIADASGHCAGCTWHEDARPVWPCSLAYYAGLARQQENLLAQNGSRRRGDRA